MDRFKFRIYIKYSNFMCYDIKSFFIDKLKQKITGYFYGNHTKTFKLDDVELMQSTGLKDKNGNLIYEHDLIKFDDDERIFEVFWDNASYCYRLGDIETKYVCTLAFVNHYNIEVIGNIHENPELLEE